MDFLAPDVLAAVCSYLPTADRLTARQLSSKFRCQPSDLPFIAMLTLQQDQNTFTFTVKYKRKQKELRQIEIIKETQKIDYIFSKSIENVEDNGQPREVHKTKIHCSRPNYYKFIDIYMELFIRDCFLQIIRLGNLNDNFLAILRKTIQKHYRNHNWKMEKRVLEMHTKNRDMTQEERTFLTFYRKPRLLRFSPPADFNPPKDFWNIPTIKNTKQLVLNFGGEVGSNWTGYTTVETDLGIDNTFLEGLIQTKIEYFTCNIISKVTIEFLINYVENCLNGNYGLLNLILRHNISYEKLLQLRANLLTKRFVQTGNEYIGHTERKPKDGWHQDQLIIKIYTNLIKIQNDTALHRGKISIRDANHPFSR